MDQPNTLPGGVRPPGKRFHAAFRVDVVISSLNIMQVHIARSRLAGEPADIMITPRLADMALMDFHRAAPAIEEGRDATKIALSEVERLLRPA